MNVTIYHRQTRETCDGACDVATAPVETMQGATAGFIGAAWGEHEAKNALHVVVCEPDDVDQVLAGWGLKRPQIEPIQGKV